MKTVLDQELSHWSGKQRTTVVPCCQLQREVARLILPIGINPSCSDSYESQTITFGRPSVLDKTNLAIITLQFTNKRSMLLKAMFRY